MTALYFIPHDGLRSYWPIIKPWVSAALRRASARDIAGGWTIEHVFDQLDDEFMQLWIMKDGDLPVACAVSELVDDPDIGRIAALPIVGGDRMADWLECVSLFEDWARQCGAAVLQGQGRKGWARVLKQYGWDDLTRRDDGAYQIRKRLH